MSFFDKLFGIKSTDPFDILEQDIDKMLSQIPPINGTNAGFAQQSGLANQQQLYNLAIQGLQNQIVYGNAAYGLAHGMSQAGLAPMTPYGEVINFTKHLLKYLHDNANEDTLHFFLLGLNEEQMKIYEELKDE